MRLRLAAVLLASGALAATAACDEARGPSAPSAPSASTTSQAAASVTALRIGGSPTIDKPGETIRLSAVATLSDGTEKDVTAEAVWSPGGTPVVSRESPGLFKALAYGTSGVSANYRGASAWVEIRVAPGGAFLIAGRVHSAAGVNLADAAVEVTSTVGAFRANTDESGLFLLPARGDGVVTVDVHGFETLRKPMAATEDTLVDLALTPAGGASAISGQYRLTVTASPSCRLPAAAMERHYDTIVEELPGGVYVRVVGDAEMVAWGGEHGFTGTRDGDALTFTIRDTYDDGYNLVERIPGFGDLHFSGTASVRVTNGTIDGGTFQGQLKLRPAWGFGMSADCAASDHRIAFAR